MLCQERQRIGGFAVQPTCLLDPQERLAELVVGDHVGDVGPDLLGQQGMGEADLQALA